MALNDWQDGAEGGTPINAARLNERDAAIVAAQNTADGAVSAAGTAQSAAEAAADTAQWAQVNGKPAVIAGGATQADARSAIGAAASSHGHQATTITVSAIADAAGVNVQEVLADLASRLAALESAEPEE